MSGKKSASELTAHDNLLAVQKIMFEQTTKAQGDFARTGDQNAGSQKKASAAMENAQAALGKGLLPVMTMGAQVMERLGKIMSTHPGLIMALAAVVGGILVAAFTAWAISAGTAAVATLAAAAPILAIIAVIALVVVAILLLAKHWHSVWNGIKAVASAVWNWLRSATAATWNFITGIVRGQINALRSAVGAVAGFFRSAWDRASTAVKTVVGGLVGFVKGIPGKILSALGDLGSLLYNAGKAVIQGLIDGIKNMIGAVGSAVSGVASTIRNFLPFSPAKEGPLSGSGSPFKAGQKIAQMVGEGIGSGRRGVGGAMGGMLGGPAASGAGVVRLEIHSGGSRLDDLLVEVLRKSIRSKGGNVQVVLGA
jgi:phage-related protein